MVSVRGAHELCRTILSCRSFISVSLRPSRSLMFGQTWIHQRVQRSITSSDAFRPVLHSCLQLLCSSLSHTKRRRKKTRPSVCLSVCPSVLPQQSGLLLLFKFLMAKSTWQQTLGPSQLPNPEVWSYPLPPPRLEEVLPCSGLQQPLLGRPPSPHSSLLIMRVII